MGVLEVLGIVFIVLKLIGVITWSWWWVVSPLLLTVALYFVTFVFLFLKNLKHYKKADKERYKK